MWLDESVRFCTRSLCVPQSQATAEYPSALDAVTPELTSVGALLHSASELILLPAKSVVRYLGWQTQSQLSGLVLSELLPTWDVALGKPALPLGKPDSSPVAVAWVHCCGPRDFHA